MIKVDSGVPLPSAKQKYPYAELQVGDSFVVSGRGLQVMCNANYRYGKKLGCVYTAKRLEDGSIRIWRVS